MNEKELQRISQQEARGGVDVGTAAEAFRQAAEMSMPTGEPVNNSPSAEQRHNFPEKAQLSREGTTSDTISRRAAIDVVNSIDNLDAKARGGICINLMGLPSAEPELIEIDSIEVAIHMSVKYLCPMELWRSTIEYLTEAGYVIAKRKKNMREVKAWQPMPKPYEGGKECPEEQTQVYYCENERYEIPERREG